jgi:hypothetical protein
LAARAAARSAPAILQSQGKPRSTGKKAKESQGRPRRKANESRGGGAEKAKESQGKPTKAKGARRSQRL